VRDVTGDPLASRKAMLIEVIVRAQLGLRFNEHLEGHGPIVFKHACSRPFESASVAV
jgi:ATP-dependent DNA ligase